jgi:gluconolactonase
MKSTMNNHQIMSNMKLINSIVVLFFLLSSCTNEFSLEHGTVQKLAGDFTFTEGPAADKAGNVYFTDIPNNRIHIWTTGGQLKLFRDSTGGANGLMFDADGNLFVCEGANRKVTRIAPSGEREILASYYDGKPFNRPNDLWIDPRGGIYFTDPAYGVDSSQLEMGVEGVYYIVPGGGAVLQVCNDLVRPNGVIGTPDGKKLYITDHYGKMTWQYDILEDGMLGNKQPFVEMGCDGLTMDALQNVYLTNVDSSSVDVFSQAGELLLSIAVPERPTNITFGGEDRSVLFITARTSLYGVEMNVKGW